MSQNNTHILAAFKAQAEKLMKQLSVARCTALNMVAKKAGYTNAAQHGNWAALKKAVLKGKFRGEAPSVVKTYELNVSGDIPGLHVQHFGNVRGMDWKSMPSGAWPSGDVVDRLSEEVGVAEVKAELREMLGTIDPESEVGLERLRNYGMCIYSSADALQRTECSVEEWMAAPMITTIVNDPMGDLQHNAENAVEVVEPAEDELYPVTFYRVEGGDEYPVTFYRVGPGHLATRLNRAAESKAGDEAREDWWLFQSATALRAVYPVLPDSRDSMEIVLDDLKAGEFAKKLRDTAEFKHADEEVVQNVVSDVWLQMSRMRCWPLLA